MNFWMNGIFEWMKWMNEISEGMKWMVEWMNEWFS